MNASPLRLIFALPLSLLLLLPAAARAQQRQPELVVQTGHTQSATTVAYSPDGRMVASGSRDATVKLWDAMTGKQLRTLAGHSLVVRSVVFSHDGRRLASASEDKTARLWDAATGAELHVWRPEKSVEGVAFSPDGRTLAGALADGSTRLWDTTTGAELRQLQAGGFVSSVAFSPDGGRIATGYSTHTVILWDAATGALLRKLEGHTGAVRSVAFAPDSRTLASAGADGTVKVWNALAGRELLTLKSDTTDKFVYAVAFSADGRTLASAHGDGAVRLWNAKTGRLSRALRWDSKTLYGAHPFYSVAFSHAGTQLAAACNDQTIKRWDMAAEEELPALRGQVRVVTSAVFSPEGKRIAFSDGMLKMWDATTGTEVRAMSDHAEFARALALSPDGALVASASNNRKLQLFDAATGRELRTLAGHPGVMQSVAFSPDGRTLASLFDSYTIKLWDTETGSELKTLGGRRGRGAMMSAIRFAPDGKSLASANDEGALELWDTASGALLKTLRGHTGFLITLAFSPDGTQLASGGSDGLIKVWDAATGAELRTLRGHTDFVRALNYSTDGRLLASASRDHTVKLWDAAAGAEVRTLNGHASEVWSAAFSPDGSLVITSSYDGTTKLWSASAGSELASLVVIGETDWLVATPEGFFDGSPGSWKQTLWRFDNNSFNFAPVESFFGEFYYPGLLQEVLAGKTPTLDGGLDVSRIDRRQPKVTLAPIARRGARMRGAGAAATPRVAHAERLVNLAVTVEENASRTAQEARHPAASGAQDVRLFRNGSLVKIWRGDVLASRGKGDCVQLRTGADGVRRVRCELSVPVVAGANEFMAYAFNHANVKSDDAILSLEGAETLRRPASLRVLAVGVNKYANEGFDLKFAVADAEGFAGEIKRQQEALGNFARVDVTLLRDARATKREILAALAALARAAQPEDTLAVYFAGHGIAHQNRFYLLPHDLGYEGERTRIGDAELGKLLSHSISDRELEEVLEAADAAQSLLVIDACNSGQALESEEKRRGPMNSKGLAQLAYEKGMYVLTAAQSFQAAQEVSKLGHGLLTYVLVEEGLKRGAADHEPKDSIVHLREWLNYATRRVPEVQVQELQRASERGVNLSFADDERGLNIKKGTGGMGQRPRVFYRREAERRPLVVARP